MSENSQVPQSSNIPRRNVSVPAPVDLFYHSLTLPRDVVASLDQSDNTQFSLANHSIDIPMRTAMVNWMIEILYTNCCKPRTFFLSVRMMDSYFKSCPAPLNNQDLRVVGVACMVIASKIEEKRPFRIAFIAEEVLNSELQTETIREEETKIFETLGYNTDIDTPVDIVGALCKVHGLEKSVYKATVAVLHVVQMYYDSQMYSATQQGVVALVTVLCNRQYDSDIAQALSQEYAFEGFWHAVSSFERATRLLRGRYPWANIEKFLRCRLMETGSLVEFESEE